MRLCSHIKFRILPSLKVKGTKFDDLSVDFCFKSIVFGRDEQLRHSFYIQKRAACFQNWPHHQITNDPQRFVGGVALQGCLETKH